MLKILIINDGESSIINQTSQSAFDQGCQAFTIKIYTSKQLQRFLSREINPNDYYWLVREGTELLPDGIAAVNYRLETGEALWYYGDERTWNLYPHSREYQIRAYPNFGKYEFLAHFHTWNSVIFSGALLQKLDINCLQPGSLIITQLAILAASLCNGEHIEIPLTTCWPEQNLTEKQTAMINRLANNYCKKRHLPFLVVTDWKNGRNYLYRKQYRPIKYTVTALGRNVAKYWNDSETYGSSNPEAVYLDSYTCWGKLCNQAVHQSSNDYILLINSGWYVPDLKKINALLDYVSLRDVGSVSPRLIDINGNDLYNGGMQVGTGFFTCNCRKKSTYSAYAEGVRETTVPSWQCVLISKKAWARGGGFSEADLSPDFCIADFALRLQKAGYDNLYCGDVRVYCGKMENPPKQRGLWYMLGRWGSSWGTDPWFTRSMVQDAVYGGNRNTALYSPIGQTTDVPSGKRILILTHELSMTGAPVVLTYAVRILREAGYQILLLSPQDGVLKNEILKEQVPVLIDQGIYEDDSWLSYAQEADLILVNTVVPFKCITQLEKLCVPVIWWLHDAKEGYETYLKNVLPRTISDQVDIYSVSEYARNVLLTFRPEYHSGVLPYGLPDLAQEVNYEDAEIPTPDKLIFLSVGTIEPRKGQDILLKAIENLRPEIREQCMFCFVGKEKNTNFALQLKEAKDEHPEYISWIPFLSRVDIFKAYQKATVVICASRDDPLPTFMAEAMMMSKICICSEYTGTASVIKQGENGFLFKKNSPRKLAQCISAIVENRYSLDSIQQQARQTYENIFSLQVFQENILKIIRKNLEEELV